MRKDRPGRRLRQGGAAATEFALIFPFLLALSYGAIVYSYAYVVRQALAFATQEAAAAAVTIDRAKTSNYDSAVTAVAVNTVNSVVAWMPTSLRSAITSGTKVAFCPGGSTGVPCPADGGSAVVVTIDLPLSTASSGLFAKIDLKPIGSFPPLPANMTATAVARV